MMLNPEALKKGQEEIDRVIGNGRLPRFEDRPNLPYVEAVYKEILRWQPVVPLGVYFSLIFCDIMMLILLLPAVPHVVSQDDFQDGYLIPKGTIIIPNSW